MEITFSYTTLYDTAERSLSVIGKRSTDENGELLFKDITLGSREKEIITDYFRQAVIDLATEMSAQITEGDADGVTVEFPSNHNSALDTFIQQSCDAYCVSYALHSWFNITAPRIAGKYLEDCKRQLAAVIRLIHNKQAPAAASDSPLGISTTITNNE